MDNESRSQQEREHPSGEFSVDTTQHPYSDKAIPIISTNTFYPNFLRLCKNFSQMFSPSLESSQQIPSMTAHAAKPAE